MFRLRIWRALANHPSLKVRASQNGLSHTMKLLYSGTLPQTMVNLMTTFLIEKQKPQMAKKKSNRDILTLLDGPIMVTMTTKFSFNTDLRNQVSIPQLTPVWMMKL